MIRPVLFGAVPIGRGTGEVESLTGFFARLCVARSILPTRVVLAFLLDRCPPDLLPSAPLRIGNFLSQCSSRFDLQSDCALPFAGALEDLTDLADLAALTLSACAPALHGASERHLGGRRKRWCPACLAAGEAEGVPLYEPLLWRFALVERCPVHRIALLDRCPVCDRFQPLITQGLPIGYCVRCGHALHHGATLSVAEDSSFDVSERWALWRSVAVSRLVAWSSSVRSSHTAGGPPSSSAFCRLLVSTLQSPSDPSVRTRLALACGLGLSANRFYPLHCGDIKPSLRTLVDVSMQLGVDPVRVVTGEFCSGERSWPPAGSSGLLRGDPWALALELREFRMSRRYPDRARALDEFIADPQAIDLEGLIRAQRTHPASLSLGFPLRNARARELRAERLVRRREETSERYNAVLDREIATGKVPSLARVAASLGVSQATVVAYSPERCARVVALRESSYSTRESGLADRVRAALVAALAVPDGPAVHEVARSLGVEDFVVQSLCRDEYRQLVDLRDREREARHAGYAAAMRADLARSPPQGITSLAVDLGVCPATLRRAAPGLYADLVAASAAHASAPKRHRERAARARSDSLCALRAKLARALERELAVAEPRSPRAVALECGVPPSALKHHCPTLYQRLLDLRDEVWSRFLDQVRSALEAEISLPEPRTVSSFAAAVGLVPLTLESSFPSLVAALRCAAVRQPKPPRPRRSQPGDARLVAALEAEARSPCPRTVTDVARGLGVSPTTLRRVSRVAVDRLLVARSEHRRQLDARLSAKVVPVLEAELRTDVPRTVHAVACDLRLLPAVVLRVAPALCHRLLARHRRAA